MWTKTTYTSDYVKIRLATRRPIMSAFILIVSFSGTAFYSSRAQAVIVGNRCLVQETIRGPQLETAISLIEPVEAGIHRVLSKPKIRLWEAEEILRKPTMELFYGYDKENKTYRYLPDEFSVQYIMYFHDAKNIGNEAWHLIHIRKRYRSKNDLLSKETREDLWLILKSLKNCSNKIKNLKFKVPFKTDVVESLDRCYDE